MSSNSVFDSKPKTKPAPLRRCLQKEDDDDTACGEIALPYANHCLNRILPRAGRSLSVVANLQRLVSQVKSVQRYPETLFSGKCLDKFSFKQ